VGAGLCPALHGAKPRAHTLTGLPQQSCWAEFRPCNKSAQIAFMGVIPHMEHVEKRND